MIPEVAPVNGLTADGEESGTKPAFFTFATSS